MKNYQSLLIPIALLLASCQWGSSSSPFSSRLLSVNNANHLKQLLTENQGSRGGIATAELDLAAPTNEGTNSNEPRTYSDTNSQVDGIQESDRVKTDGQTIYYVSPWQSNLHVLKTFPTLTYEQIALVYEDQPVMADSLYLLEHHLIVMGSTYAYHQSSDDLRPMLDYWWGYQQSVILVFDRQTLTLTYGLALSQHILDHRIVPHDDPQTQTTIHTLYLVHYEWIYNTETIQLPIIDVLNDEDKRVGYDDLYYFENTERHGFLNLISLRFVDDHLPTLNITSYLSTYMYHVHLYVNHEYMMLAQVRYQYENNRSFQTTHLAQFAIVSSSSSLQFETSLIIKGALLNRYAMDIYQGVLRIATTDEQWTWTNTNWWVWDTSSRTITNRLFLFQMTPQKTLSPLATIEEGLGKPGESIMSVRYQGHLVYIVTFEQIDPLYIIDVGNPTNPVILAELTLPGFDVYQHPWSTHHLIGLGFEIDATTGQNLGLKMTLYDVGEQAEVIHTHILIDSLPGFTTNHAWSYTYAEAWYNPRALLVSTIHQSLGFGLQHHSGGSVVRNPGTADDRDASSEQDEVSYMSDYQSYFVYVQVDMNQTSPFTMHYLQHAFDVEAYDVIDRGVIIENTLYVLSAAGVSCFDVSTLNRLDSLTF